MSRLPQSWAGRVVWIMLGISAFWVAYRFGFNYVECRADGTNKGGCVLFASFFTWTDIVVAVTVGVAKILSSVLP
jgi:hypothetical protein